MAEESKVLVISAGDEMRDNIALIARDYGFGDISVSDGTKIRDVLSETHFDLVILNTPLANEFGLELVAFISQNTDSAVIVAAAQKNCDEISRKIGYTGACVLPKPLNKAVLLQTIRFVMSARSRLLDETNKNKRLEQKLRDMKQIDRAKCVLIQYLRISEADAHRQIQKRAMDQRVSEAVIAQDILRTYEM